MEALFQARLGRRKSAALRFAVHHVLTCQHSENVEPANRTLVEPAVYPREEAESTGSMDGRGGRGDETSTSGR